MSDANGAWPERLVVLAGVKRDGLTLRHAVAKLRADKNIVLEAVNNNPHALKCAVEELRGPREPRVEPNVLALETPCAFQRHPSSRTWHGYNRSFTESRGGRRAAQATGPQL